MVLDAHQILDEEDFDISLSTVASNPPQPQNLEEEHHEVESDDDVAPPNPIPPVVDNDDLLFVDESHIEISFDDDEDDFDESNSPSAVLSGPPQEIEAVISGAPQEIQAENATKSPAEIKLEED